MINVSVVIPTHKRVNLLKRAIESVIAQTMPIHEVIVVDDAACAETRSLVESFKLTGLVYVNNEYGQGASSSRNLGVQHAKGDYIAFLDDDDEWLDRKLEKQINKIELAGLDACFSRALIKYEGTDISYGTRASKSLSSEIDILIENFLGATPSAIIKKRVFHSLGGFDEKLPAREEYDLWLRLIHAGFSYDVIEEPLFVSYRSLEKRERISASIDRYSSAVEMLNQKHRSLIEKYLNDDQRRIRREKQLFFLGAQSAAIGLRFEALKYYSQAFMISPSFKSFAMGLISMCSPVLLIKLRSKVS